MNVDDPDFDDEGYQRWLAECASECRCCRDCRGGGIPCAGITAGGLCDQMCVCDDGPDCSDPCGDDGYDSDYEDQP